MKMNSPREISRRNAIQLGAAAAAATLLDFKLVAAESARMGLCWTIGKGRVFYFTPGHETYNDYYRPEVRRIFVNAVKWASA